MKEIMNKIKMYLQKVFKINKKKEGFTLVEVMVTVTIIGILSSIAMMSYSDVQKKAKENIDYATAANIATAAQMAITQGTEASLINLDLLTSKGYLQTEPKPQQSGKTSFSVSVNETTEKITVSLDGTQVYPK